MNGLKFIQNEIQEFMFTFNKPPNKSLNAEVIYWKHQFTKSVIPLVTSGIVSVPYFFRLLMDLSESSLVVSWSNQMKMSQNFFLASYKETMEKCRNWKLIVT
jgi:hypothetical protein